MRIRGGRGELGEPRQVQWMVEVWVRVEWVNVWGTGIVCAMIGVEVAVAA
jgi:hypothetical protein